MDENLTPQNQQDDELSVEELDDVAGGTGEASKTIIINGVPGCGGDYNDGC
jgi:hypothetical protein